MPKSKNIAVIEGKPQAVTQQPKTNIPVNVLAVVLNVQYNSAVCW